MGKTSTESRTRYNECSYARYTIRVRKDSCLYADIEQFMEKRGTSLNYLVTKLLTAHFNRFSDD